MVRAIVSPVVRLFLFASCFTAIVGFMSNTAFAAGDLTLVTINGTASPTTGTSCDTLPANQSCLGQRVHFHVEVGDAMPTPNNGSPLGIVLFNDENGITIGFATLTADTAQTSGADFETAILTGTATVTTNCPLPGVAGHCIKAQFQSADTTKWAGNFGTSPWQVVGRPTTTTATPTPAVVVGTTGHAVTASVMDAGPAPQAAQANGTQVAGGQFFLANDAAKPTPNVFTLKTARYGEAAAAMPNGNVLIVGGADNTNTVLKSAELIGNGVTASAGTLNTARVFLTATPGLGGNVLIAGGSTDQCMSAADLKTNALTSNAVQSSLERYTFATDTFSTLTPTITARCGHTTIRLANGNFAFIGGYDSTGAPIPSIDVFSPSAGTVAAGAATLTTARAGAMAVVLQNGSVLIAGGDAAGDAEIWDGVSATTTAVTGTMTVPRMFFAGSIMPDGNVFFAGGFSASDSTEKAIASAEIYDVANSKFSAITATLLNGGGTAGPAKEFGSVIVVDGFIGFAGGRDDSNTVLNTIQAYAPAYTPQGLVNFTSDESTDDLGGTGAAGPVPCTLDVSNGTTAAACSAGTVTTYHARHVKTGTHNVTATYAGSNNSATSNGAAPVTVNPTPLTITAKDQTKFYGVNFNFAGTEVSAPNLINGDTVTVTLASAGAAPIAGVVGGPYPITASSAVISPSADTNDYDTPSYNPAPTGFTVNPLPIVFTASSPNKFYGEVRLWASPCSPTGGACPSGFTTAVKAGLPGPAITVNGNGLPNTDSFDAVTITDQNTGGASTAAAGGSYQLMPSTPAPHAGTLLSNYDLTQVGTFVPGTLTVNPLPIVITAKPSAKFYGEVRGWGAGCTTTGGPCTSGFSAAIRSDITDVVANSNGLANADSIDSVTISDASAGLSTTAAGAYQLTPSAPVAHSGTLLSNYDLTAPTAFVAGALTVNRLPIVITAAPSTKFYGQAPSWGSGSVCTKSGGPCPTGFSTAIQSSITDIVANANGLPNADSIASVAISASNGGDQSTANAGGTYQLTPSSPTAGAGTSLSNYDLTAPTAFVPANLTVNPLPIVITASSPKKFYGEVRTWNTACASNGSNCASSFTTAVKAGLPGPAISVNANGLPNTDSLDAVTITDQNSGGASTAAAGGSYQLVPSGTPTPHSGTLLSNYDLTQAGTFVNGTLTVNPLPIVITAKSPSKFYGEVRAWGPGCTAGGGACTSGFSTAIRSDITDVAANANGLANTDSIDSVTIADANGAGASIAAAGGSYQLMPMAGTPSPHSGTSLSNYDLTAPTAFVAGTVTVNPLPIMVVAASPKKLYGQAIAWGAGCSAVGGGCASGFSTTINPSITDVVANSNGLANNDRIASVSIADVGNGGAIGAPVNATYQLMPAGAVGDQNTSVSNYAPTYVAGNLTINKAMAGVRAESVATSIDASGNTFISSMKVFLYNASVPGSNGTGMGQITGSVSVLDNGVAIGTLSNLQLSPTIAGTPSCSNCGAEATYKFQTGQTEIILNSGATHALTLAYTPDTNFNGQVADSPVPAGTVTGKTTASVGSVAAAGSNSMPNNIPPLVTTTSQPLVIFAPEGALGPQTYNLTCSIHDSTGGLVNLANVSCAVLDSSNKPLSSVTLASGQNANLNVSVTTTLSAELHMRSLFDLSFGVPAVVLVGGLPLVGLRRRVKGRKLMACVAMTIAIVLLLALVACGGNGFQNIGNIPVTTKATAQSGRFTIVVTGKNASDGNQFDFASVPFVIGQ